MIGKKFLGEVPERVKDLAIVFVSLNVLDATLTRMAIDLGSVELNPIISQFVHSPAFWAYKIIVPAGIAFGILAASRKFPKPARRILIGLVLGMAAVCVWNTVAIISLGG